MPSRTLQAAALVLLLGPASLVGKLVMLEQPGPGVENGPAQSSEVIEILATGGLQRVGLKQMLNVGGYEAEVYHDERRPARCSGLVYLMRIATNAEASTLLTHLGSLPIVDSFFVFQGRISETFPSYMHWLEGVTRRINGLLGPHQELPTVYAVAATANCMRPRTLPWNRLADFN